MANALKLYAYFVVFVRLFWVFFFCFWGFFWKGGMDILWWGFFLGGGCSFFYDRNLPLLCKLANFIQFKRSVNEINVAAYNAVVAKNFDQSGKLSRGHFSTLNIETKGGK